MHEENQMHVQDTNEQALASKISAIRKGYFQDNFAEQFTHFNGKRDIIIHRGYWARVHLVRRLIEAMIMHAGDQVQIISLGCGMQTLWFNLLEEGVVKNQFRFIELDLQGVVRKKIKKINHSKKLTKLFNDRGIKPEYNQHLSAFKCGQYYLLASCDLSNLEQFSNILTECGVEPAKPTLFYCECVLSYIQPDRIDDLMVFISQHFNLAYVFDYEMYNPHDRFGQMMVKNFAERGCPLIGIYKYPELQDQEKRYINAGFKQTECYTMARIYYECIDKAERTKIEKLQMLDQLEEWNLIMGHYFGLLSLTFNAKGQQHPRFGQLYQNVRLKR